MTRTSSSRRRLVLALGLMLASLPLTPAAVAVDATIPVAQAIASPAGTNATVRGYVVGQPTATQTVVTTAFPNDYALALADTVGETNTANMLYVQIPAALRPSFGLLTNPGLMGDRIDVTGSVGAYFAHAGLKLVTSITAAAPDPVPDPGGYYNGTAGLQGPQLEAALHAIISQQTTLSYAQVWEALKVTDQDPANANNVILLYTGRSQSKTSNGGGVDQWNREHVWAQSHGNFGTVPGPGTDIHHLRPADVTVNAARGNLDFDNGGIQSVEAPGNYSDSNSWEPRDAVKGDIARMIFYMSVRYEGGDGFADLEVNDLAGNGSNPNMGRLSVLLAWNAQDPPSAFEQRRNEVIFTSFQGNRNPFIDHPEWAQAIWAA